MLEQIARNEGSLTIVCLSIVGVVAILVFGAGCTLVSVLRVIAHTRLKQQMLDRGLTPSEIEQVLKAGSDEFKSKWHQPVKPPLREPNRSWMSPSKLDV
jgi:hypothetical protein